MALLWYNRWWQPAHMTLSCARELPGSEISIFPVVAIVRKVHFWPDEENLSMENEHTAVVPDAFVNDWHAHIDYDVAMALLQQVPKTFP
jgi:hypothetical protein